MFSFPNGILYFGLRFGGGCRLTNLLCVQLRHDVELLVRMIKTSYTEEVLALLNGSIEDVMVVVRESLSMGSQSLLTMVPALSDVLTEALTEKCVEVRLSFSL